jgi:pimeloyl-ACP methyl ester carboxylesterase
MLLLALLACAEPAPSVADPCAEAQDVRIRTADGATVALHRHAAPGGPPVLLVHGISSNTRYWDLDAERSLAVWLRARGHDVWLLDLRGHGRALDVPGDTSPVSGWTVDDYGRYDVDAAVQHVLAATGAPALAYVGHSMGGLVGAVYLHHHGAARIASFTALGSPARFSQEDPLVGLAALALDLGGAATDVLDTRDWAELAADLDGYLPRGVQERLYNPAHLAPEVIPRMLRGIVSPMTTGEMRHFADMIDAERFQSADGSIDYLAALRGLPLPALAVAGLGDEVVPPERARAWRETFDGRVRVLDCGRAVGMAEDYGHLDFTLGRNAPTELWPTLDAFLREHPPGAPRLPGSGAAADGAPAAGGARAASGP